MTKKHRKTRKRYEDYGVARSQIEKDWGQLVGSGNIDDPLEWGAVLRDKCQEMHFPLTPKDGWEHIAREFRIIHWQLPQPTTVDSLSQKEMAKAYSKFAEQLLEIAHEMNEFSHQKNFIELALLADLGHQESDKFRYANLHNHIFELVVPIQKFTQWLNASSKSQPHKFRPAAERERRLILACKLAPVFKDQFGIETKLRGGSSTPAIEDDSPWAQFYEAASVLAFGKGGTFDRQGVLLEARLPTE